MKHIKLFEQFDDYELDDIFGNNLFKSNSDRELWIKLNAERMIEWEKNLTYFDIKSQSLKPTQQALNHRSMDEALEISRRQCEIDEKRGKLRYSFEDLLILNNEDLTKKGEERRAVENYLNSNLFHTLKDLMKYKFNGSRKWQKIYR